MEKSWTAMIWADSSGYFLTLSETGKPRDCGKSHFIAAFHGDIPKIVPRAEIIVKGLNQASPQAAAAIIRELQKITRKP